MGVAGGAQAEVGDIRVVRRDIIVSERGEDGSRFIIDAITLVNRNEVPVPTWSVAIPDEVIGLEVAEADVAPAAIRHESDRIVLTAPLPPGTTRIVLHYVLPPAAARWALALDHAVDTLAVVTRVGDVAVHGAQFAADEPGGAIHPVRRSVAVALEPGVEIRFVPVRVRRPVHAYWWVIVFAAAVTMALTLVWWWRRNAPLARAGTAP